jgi:hypothetical protein
MRERGDKRFDTLSNIITARNSHAEGVMKLLNEYYPSFARKIFEGNPLVEKFVRANFTTLDILLHPVCGRCETIALFSGGRILENGSQVKVATCPKCGMDTVNPITLLEWCLMELKRKAPETIESDLILATDIVAERLVTDMKRIYAITKEKEYVSPFQP